MSYLPFAFARAAIIKALNAAEETQIDAIPEQFNNSIRWNAGHALVIADKVLNHAEDYSHKLPDHYRTFFDMGTSPRDWTEAPPSLEDLSEMSRLQLEASAKIATNDDGSSKLTNAFELRGLEFSTVPELLGFLAYHEGMHYDTIKILLRLTEK